VSGLLIAHRSVLESSVAIVQQVRTADLDRPTPCAGWTVARLLAHMIGQNYGFAAAAAGHSTDVAVFADRPVGCDPAVEYAAAASRVIAAFGAPGVLERNMFLPEVRGGMSFPAEVAIGFHLVDYVAHGWDVARSVGAPAVFEESALEVALQVAQAVPEEAKTADPATPFGPSVPWDGVSTLDRIVVLLGRSPVWPTTERR
jgi:uncharacterized protein (TIGR03086 family)